MNRHQTLWLLLAAFGPFLLMSLYLILSRSVVDQYNARSDEVAEVLSCALGAVGVVKCTPHGWSRLLVLVIYVPLTGLFLAFYGLIFVCAVFRDCL